ncbi:MAG TPA: hypothetical protein ENL08_06445, partial [Bacteroidetes bacterium]|nr:hypothetical protein [Bacteroidota bacterium]
MPDQFMDIPGTETNEKAAVEFKRLVVIGGGSMGRAIVVSAVRHGIEVLLIEKNETTLKQSLQEISDSLDREIARWALTESEKKVLLSSIKGVVEFSEITDEQFLIEALPEN